MQPEENDSSKSLLRQLLGDDVSSRSLMNMLSQDPRKEKGASNQAKRVEPGAAMNSQKPSKSSKIVEEGFSFGREKKRASAADGGPKRSCIKKRVGEGEDGEVGEIRDINSHHLNAGG